VPFLVECWEFVMMRMLMMISVGRTWMVKTFHLLRAGLVLDPGEEDSDEEEEEGWRQEQRVCVWYIFFIYPK